MGVLPGQRLNSGGICENLGRGYLGSREKTAAFLGKIHEKVKNITSPRISGALADTSAICFLLFQLRARGNNESSTRKSASTP